MSLYIFCICKVHNMLRTSLNIKRDLTVSCASRVMTGPDVVGCRYRQLCSVCSWSRQYFQAGGRHLRGVQRQGGGSAEGGCAEGQQHPCHRRHVKVSHCVIQDVTSPSFYFQTCTREPHRAEEVHARREEAEPGGQHSAAVRQAVRQPPLLRLERFSGEGRGVHPGK